jgi:hypothetical protein
MLGKSGEHIMSVTTLVESVSESPRGGGLEYLHCSPASRRRRRKGEASAWGYKWATLFLGDISTGTCPTRLGESRI